MRKTLLAPGDPKATASWCAGPMAVSRNCVEQLRYSIRGYQLRCFNSTWTNYSRQLGNTVHHPRDTVQQMSSDLKRPGKVLTNNNMGKILDNVCHSQETTSIEETRTYKSARMAGPQGQRKILLVYSFVISHCWLFSRRKYQSSDISEEEVSPWFHARSDGIKELTHCCSTSSTSYYFEF